MTATTGAPGRRTPVSDENWASFASRLSFAPASAEQPAALVEAVARAEQDLGPDVRRLRYLAVPPRAFVPMVEMLGASSLAERARVIVEKPFGRELDSAHVLNRTLHAALGESQSFRIDHFLGKEAVQNILAFRFGNGLSEPVWHREQTGTFRDMVVTHLLHLPGFIAMEPPDRLDARSLRDASAEVFAAIEPLDPSARSLASATVTGTGPGSRPVRRSRRSPRWRSRLTVKRGRG